jgi:hypothetical protein
MTARPTGAFDVVNPRAMLEKLGREMSRIAEPGASYEAVMDAGINGALTAWHLTDWVWVARFRDDPEARKTIEILTDDPRDGKRDFQAYVTRECSELALCEDVTNGFKHVVANQPARRARPGAARSRVDTNITVTSGGGRITEEGFLVGPLPGGAGAMTGTTEYRLEIIHENGTTCSVLDVFQSARDFWANFLDNHGIT